MISYSGILDLMKYRTNLLISKKTLNSDNETKDHETFGAETRSTGSGGGGAMKKKKKKKKTEKRRD